MADEDVVDGGEFAERVVDGEDRAAGVAEDGGGAFAGEGGPEDFGAGEGGVLVMWHRFAPFALSCVRKFD